MLLCVLRDAGVLWARRECPRGIGTAKYALFVAKLAPDELRFAFLLARVRGTCKRLSGLLRVQDI